MSDIDDLQKALQVGQPTPLTNGGVLTVESIDVTFKSVTFDFSAYYSPEYKFLCAMEKLIGRTLGQPGFRDVSMTVSNGNH